MGLLSRRPNSFTAAEGELTSITIFSEYIHSVQNSTGYYWDSIIRRLAQTGRPIRVLTPNFTPDPREAYPPNVILDRFPAYLYNSKRPITRLAGQTIQSFELAWKLARTIHKKHTLLTGTNPAMSLLIQAIMRKCFNFNWILIVHDVFPDNLVPGELSSSTSLVYRIAHTLFRWAFRQADQLVSIGRDMSEVLVRRGIAQERITYIRHWVDPQKTTPQITPTQASIWQLPSDIRRVFLFFGNMGRLQGLPTLLDAIRIARLGHAAFLFIGKGALSKEVLSFCQLHPELNCHYEPILPNLSSEQILTLGDVALVPLARGMYGLGVPSKACFSLAAGKPILVVGDVNSELHRIVQETQTGWFTPSGDPKTLAEMLAHIANTEIMPASEHCRSVAEHLYSQDLALLQIESLLSLRHS